MGLKKYSDFASTGGGSSKTITSSVPEIPKEIPIKKANLAAMAQELSKPPRRDNRDPNVSRKKPRFKLNGKVAKFLDNYKPSDAYSLLESNNHSKDDLHFMIIEQTDKSLLVLKYNENHELKLKEFVDNLVSYYRRNPQLDKLFSEIVVEGNDVFSIIKNVPQIELNGKKVLQILNDDLMNLLKNV